MVDYKAPLRDIRFTMNELLDYPVHYAALPGGEEVSPDLVTAILEEGAKFCESVLAPLNRVGDIEGCKWKDGEVTTPTGFKEAYQQYVEAGWPSMTQSPEFGGQGLPASLKVVMSEMVGASNGAWAMYPSLAHGATKTLAAYGTKQQQQTYLTKLVEGRWTSTMCLTESHCGTDLGLLRTKATPENDGSFSIEGTKIFISSGEHDMAENIVHIVLARLPDALAGSKGISLFLVPKFNVTDSGNIANRNNVRCGSIEHKMGIHGNATCVMNFDGAKGYLIGEQNKGLQAMFIFMNTARLESAAQGLAHAELGFQKSLEYARERLQMRSLSGTKHPGGPADPIIVHPDVRRMLLTQKAFSEGGRMLAYFTAQQADLATSSPTEELRKTANERLDFLTPIAKAFMTETGFESANLGVQCFGGHGYISEWGVEQNVRDCRISMLYEGTTGIQALDLLGRKVLGSNGKILKSFTRIIEDFCRAQINNKELEMFVTILSGLIEEWHELTNQIGAKAIENPDEIGAASVDYLMYSGYVILAYFWALAASKAQESLKLGVSDKDFYEAKVSTAHFYYQRILPRTKTYAETIKSGAETLMELPSDNFSF